MAALNDYNGKRIFVLTPGLPGWGLMDYSYWDTLTFDNHWTREMGAKLILVEPGPMSSYHDRACEIFAQLYGTLTDFGKEHSELYGHNRYGRNFSYNKMLRGHWSEENPINFICHCVGINTIRYLQFLLAEDFWGVGTNENWIKSIISINGNINGTQFLHFLGIDFLTGTSSKKKLLKSTKRIFNGALWTLNKLKNLTEIQREKAIDWHLNHWNVSTIADNWLSQMQNESNIFTNKDNLFYDSTIHGSKFLNSIVPDAYPFTYYCSFYAISTKSNNSFHVSHQLNPILFAPSSYLLHTKFASGLLNSAIYRNAEWCDNDGIYPVASQMFPVDCQRTVRLESLISTIDVRKGFWHYGDLQKLIGCRCIIDHFSMIWCRKFLKCESFQLPEKEQKEFYVNLLTFLMNLQ